MTKSKKEKIKIAYFSMEIAIENDIKSYSGGLGVLAGDTLKTAADLKIPMLGITLLSSHGYFKQVINENGEQEEEPDNYDYSKFKEIEEDIFVFIGEDKVKIRAWEYEIKSDQGYSVPVYFLDTDLEENKEEHRALTRNLYGGGREYRLMQEIVLGRGGVKLLSALNYDNIQKHHINEGHAALAAIELFLQEDIPLWNKKDIEKATERIRKKCVFTTHTPVAAGHDIFPEEMIKRLQLDFPLKVSGLITDKKLNMSRLALHFSSYVNGVALKHKEISTQIFPGHEIAAITNGVHSKTWTDKEFKKLFDEKIPAWRNCSLFLRNAFNISSERIWSVHQKAKRRLLEYINKKEGKELSEDVFTVGFARRFAEYKRSTLLFHDMEKLLEIHEKVGKMQIIYAGKAHPDDHAGKEMIKRINQIIKEYEGKIDIVFLEDYDMSLAKLLISGVDIWLNTPLPPNEASGTSGMKAAHNGVPQLSTLDGWWLEGCIEGKTGWAIEATKNQDENNDSTEKDAVDLYRKLEENILPIYYKNPDLWYDIMRYTIAINASFFNSERMLRQYAQEAYL